MKSERLAIAILFVTTLSVVCAETTGTRDQKPDRKPQPAAEVNPKQDSRSEVDPEIKKFQGNWQVISWADESGELVPPEELKQFTFLFEGDRLTMRKFKDDSGTLCQFRVDATKQPKWIDLGMPSLAAGSTVLEGIYSLEGDEMNLCITSGLRNGAAPPRPTEFKTKPNEKYAVLSLKRIP